LCIWLARYHGWQCKWMPTDDAKILSSFIIQKQVGFGIGSGPQNWPLVYHGSITSTTTSWLSFNIWLKVVWLMAKGHSNTQVVLRRFLAFIGRGPPHHSLWLLAWRFNKCPKPSHHFGSAFYQHGKLFFIYTYTALCKCFEMCHCTCHIPFVLISRFTILNSCESISKFNILLQWAHFDKLFTKSSNVLVLPNRSFSNPHCIDAWNLWTQLYPIQAHTFGQSKCDKLWCHSSHFWAK